MTSGHCLSLSVSLTVWRLLPSQLLVWEMSHLFHLWDCCISGSVTAAHLQLGQFQYQHLLLVDRVDVSKYDGVIYFIDLFKFFFVNVEMPLPSRTLAGRLGNKILHDRMLIMDSFSGSKMLVDCENSTAV